ncbi:MAG: hypothetical protein KDA75_22805 [Planctomycetaceae bacterium]|nr:hypothetical protein [Planctomycetaceae bacterium]
MPIRFLLRYLSKLRFPWLFGLMLTLFGIDLVLPDFIPLVDELLLGLMTLVLGSWKQRKQASQEPSEADVLPTTSKRIS